MKKALSEVSMTESESQAVRQTIKQGRMYVQPLSVSISKTSLEKIIPYTIVSNVRPSEPRRKSKRLVEAMTTKTKRVKQQGTGPGKMQKTSLKIVETNDEEEEEQEIKQENKVTLLKQSTRKSWQP